MNQITILMVIAKADFLDRVRTNRFRITLFVFVLLGYLLVPADGSAYNVMRFSGYRGVYNSAWLGVMVALPTSFLFSLIGFYLVKNSVERDMKTGVGDIIATTPVTKQIYIFGKWLSNLMVLFTAVVILFISAIVMQYVHGESTSLQLWQLAAPFILITIPVMMVVAALAVLFETRKILSKGFGNIVYFFLWLMMIILSEAVSWFDFLGVNFIMSSIQKEAASFLNEPSVSAIVLGIGEQLGTFTWSGLDWTFFVILERFLWVVVSFIIVLFTSLLFNRFDDSRRYKLDNTKVLPVIDESLITANKLSVKLNNLEFPVRKGRLIEVTMIELKLLVKGLSIWWWGGFVIIIIFQISLNHLDNLSLVLALTWIWPLLVWSKLGAHAFNTNTQALLLSTPGRVYPQLIGSYLAGIIFTLMTVAILLIKLIILQGFTLILPIIIGGIFIVCIAQFLGILTRSSKTFEIVYLALLWYLGLLNGVPFLDFTGITSNITTTFYVTLLLITILVVLTIYIKKNLKFTK